MRNLAVVVLALAFVASGCAGGGGQEAPPPAPSSPSVFLSDARVKSVTVKDDSLEAEKQRTLRHYSGHEEIKTGVVSKLVASDHYDRSGSLDLVIDVTNFRLRGGATVYILGIMAGVDSIHVDVQVLDGGNEIKRFQTSSSSMGHALSGDQRTRYLIDALVNRIVAEL